MSGSSSHHFPPVAGLSIVAYRLPERLGVSYPTQLRWPSLDGVTGVTRSRMQIWRSQMGCLLSLFMASHFLFYHLKKRHPGLPACPQLSQGSMCFFSQLSQPEEVARLI